VKRARTSLLLSWAWAAVLACLSGPDFTAACQYLTPPSTTPTPAEDPFLPAPYTAETSEAGKAAARAELRRRLGLSGWDDRLLVGVVSRLTGQKGVHLIKHAAWRTRDRGGQFALLGSAPDPRVQVRGGGDAAGS
jgi:hypothetical protein